MVIILFYKEKREGVTLLQVTSHPFHLFQRSILFLILEVYFVSPKQTESIGLVFKYLATTLCLVDVHVHFWLLFLQFFFNDATSIIESIYSDFIYEMGGIPNSNQFSEIKIILVLSVEKPPESVNAAGEYKIFSLCGG